MIDDWDEMAMAGALAEAMAEELAERRRFELENELEMNIAPWVVKSLRQ